MRNLKKILALVLALVMSLSLMATAGAADFKDASSINEKYETAVEVLEGLGVFRGYEDGSFQPTGSITRAETAAIIYRIVTGDVKDEQVGIYADYNLFTDVPSTAWFAGYVNYCANAEYIKGVGGGKFNPNAQVTGYAALAMILRAIGYTANGGFTGPDWEVQTARVGEARKITKNIMTGTLGQPATRESVAEILFQAILVNMVNHNVLNAQNGQQGYFETDMTLGYKTFKLEQIEGIVMANEYANLNGSRVIGKDKTDLQVAGEEGTRRLAKGTEITDIGESRYAYVSGSKVLAFGDTGKNKVTETGKAVDISSASKFSAVAEMPAASDIEYYSNFELSTAGNKSCDQRLEFSVTFYGPDAEEAFDVYRGINISSIAGKDEEWSVENVGGTATAPTYTKVELNAGEDDYKATTTTPAYKYPVRYTKIIWAGVDITKTDLAVLESIFGTADNKDNNKLPEKRITGDVFVGTKSTNNESTDEERDLSNTISYKKFVADYLNDNASDVNWNKTWNGWWAKFVDNDGDGACEYAFRTNYALEEVLYTYTDRDGNVYYEFNDFDDEGDIVAYLDGYTPAVGDKVLAAYIDGQYMVEPANSETVVVSAYSWRADEITTDKGPYGQSGINNATGMQEVISNMDEKTEYVIYLDHFGYVRAYELPGGTKYALITELYYNNDNQGNKVTNWPMTAELTMPDADGKAQTAEYSNVGGAATFTAKAPWALIQNLKGNYNFYNWLQPAISGLGVTRDGYKPVKGEPAWALPENLITFWPADYQLVREIAAKGMDAVKEFNYGAQDFGTRTYKGYGYDWDVDATASFTNVAVVNDNGENITLSGAATLNLNKDGTVKAAQPYATNYIQLSTADIAKGAVRYAIGGTSAYQTANNTWVNAVHDTEYYIVYNGGVYYTKDYVNFPGLDAEDNMIHAAYAVARNTNADNDGDPYWVADVIVYEIYDVLDNLSLTSVSLAFFRESRETDKVQKVRTLNSKYDNGDDGIILTPDNYDWWATDWAGLGFYGLYNDTEPVDGTMTASDVDKLGIGDYAKNNIHAGTIVREVDITDKGEYIDVDMGNGKIVSLEVTDKIYSITKSTVRSDNGKEYEVYDASLLRTQGSPANREVRVNDMVIWVGGAKTDGISGGKNSTNFVVDMGSLSDWGNAYAGEALLVDTAPFLIDTYKDAAGKLQVTGYGAATNSSGLWQQIMFEQTAPVAPLTIKAVKVYDAADATETQLPGVDATVAPATFTAKEGEQGFNVKITVPAPYAITAVTVSNVGEKLAGKNARIMPTNDPDTWHVSDATGNVELKVAVTKIEYTVAVNVATGVSANNMKIEVNGTSTNWNGAAKKLVKGTNYRISFDAAAGTTYYVDGVKTAPQSGKIVLTGTLNADKTYNVTKTTKELTVNVAAGSGLVLTHLQVNGTNATVGTPVTLAEDAAYTVTFDAAANTTYTVDGVETAAAAGKITITGKLAADKTIVIGKLETTLKVKATLTGVTDLLVKVNGTDVTTAATAVAGATANKGAGYEISFTAVPTYTYTVDGVEKAANNAGKIVVTGKVDTNMTIEIKETSHAMPDPDTTTKPGTTIYNLTDDVMTANIVLSGDTIINLNRHTIDFTETDHGFFLDGGDSLTIVGPGTIIADSKPTSCVINVEGNGNTVTIGAGVVIQGNNTLDEDGDGYSYGIVINPGATNTTINMNGTLTGACGLTVNGLNKNTSVGTININGTIDVEDCGLYLAGNAVTNINEGAEIIAGHTGIEIRNGKLNMTGGSVAGNVSAPTYFRPTPAGGGSTGFNAGIVVSSYNNGPIDVQIFGGAVSGRTQLALKGILSAAPAAAMHIEYLNSVIKTLPMFGDNNEQRGYWTTDSDDVLGTTILDWAYTA